MELNIDLPVTLAALVDEPRCPNGCVDTDGSPLRMNVTEDWERNRLYFWCTYCAHDEAGEALR